MSERTRVERSRASDSNYRAEQCWRRCSAKLGRRLRRLPAKRARRTPIEEE